MKKVIFTFLFCSLYLSIQAQNASVEKSVYGIQTGLLGIWVNEEVRLSNQFALRGELGLDGGIFSDGPVNRTGFILTPVITVAPRWYYNLDKRERKSKRIRGNTGNFVSLKTSFHPDWFTISNSNNSTIIPDISIIPTWGIRRNIGNHFNYETGIGLGYVYYFAKNAGFRNNSGEAAVNLHLRIGYRF